ncbi:MAG TPA: phosphate ABC transporter permease subunit PstC, partial [Acidimicrobiales bacterium]|nr:phosphate ABC transporter permease subunit PstC [Acidimicrobiales bacterium]
MTVAWSDPPGLAATLRARAAGRRSARWYPAVYWLGGLVFVAVAVALVVSIAGGSASAFAHSGIGFLWSGTWNPDAGDYGAGILIVGTLVTTGVAMVLAVPVGIGVAVALSELAPKRVAGPVGAAIEFLAAIPSIVVGLWALLVLSPVFQRHVEPFLGSVPGLHWLFGGADDGPSILLASLVLAVMTLPTMVALSRSAMAAVAPADREAAMALGATRWQVVRTAVLPASRSGLAAAATLAVGRALGESIAVSLVIGNNPSVPHALDATGATLGSAIVNQFAEASPGLQTSSVIGLGAVLLILTVAVNVGGQAVLRRGHRPGGAPPRGPAPGAASPFGARPALEMPADVRGRRPTAGIRTVQQSAGRSLGRRR